MLSSSFHLFSVPLFHVAISLTCPPLGSYFSLMVSQIASKILFYLHISSLPRANPSSLHHLPLESGQSVKILGLPNFIMALLLFGQIFCQDKSQWQVHSQECLQLVPLMLCMPQLLLTHDPVVPDQKVFEAEETKPGQYLFICSFRWFPDPCCSHGLSFLHLQDLWGQPWCYAP